VLSGSRTLESAAAARFAAAVAHLSLAHPRYASPHVVHCPLDDGSTAIVVLAYPGRPDVDLWLDTSGCRGMRNGFISGHLSYDPAFLAVVTPGPGH
jgi:hypothetical protein